VDLDDEGNCPICQMEICEGDELTWCRKGCGRNIHADCMKHWADHKKVSNAVVSCPYCRVDWGQLATHNIREDKKECKGKNRSITHVG